MVEFLADSTAFSNIQTVFIGHKDWQESFARMLTAEMFHERYDKDFGDFRRPYHTQRSTAGETSLRKIQYTKHVMEEDFRRMFT